MGRNDDDAERSASQAYMLCGYLSIVCGLDLGGTGLQLCDQGLKALLLQVKRSATGSMGP